MKNGDSWKRVWTVEVVNEQGYHHYHGSYSQADTMAELLNDLDMKGYYITKLDYRCILDSPYLVHVDLVVNYGAWTIHNIPEKLPDILGMKKEGD